MLFLLTQALPGAHAGRMKNRQGAKDAKIRIPDY
jgi:hypothetical protein